MAERDSKIFSIQKPLFGGRESIDVVLGFNNIDAIRIYPPATNRIATGYFLDPNGRRIGAECIDGGVEIKRLSGVVGLTYDHYKTRFTGPVIASKPVGTSSQLISQIDFGEEGSVFILEPGTDNRVGIWDTRINPFQTNERFLSQIDSIDSNTEQLNRSKQEVAEVNADNFAHDVIKHLTTNPRFLDPLQMNSIQQRVYEDLIRSDHTLDQESTGVKENEYGKKYVYKIYSNSHEQQLYIPSLSVTEALERDIIEKSNDLLHSLDLVVCFGFDDDFIPRFDFQGGGFNFFGSDITLLGLPKQIENEEEAFLFLRDIVPSTDKFLYQISDDGSSVIRYDVGKPKPGYGEKLDRGLITEIFYYLGAFHAPLLRKDYFIYGINDLLGLLKRRGE